MSHKHTTAPTPKQTHIINNTSRPTAHKQTPSSPSSLDTTSPTHAHIHLSGTFYALDPKNTFWLGSEFLPGKGERVYGSSSSNPHTHTHTHTHKHISAATCVLSYMRTGTAS